VKQTKSVPKKSSNPRKYNNRDTTLDVCALDAETRVLLLIIHEAFSFGGEPTDIVRYSPGRRRQIHDALILLKGIGLVEETDTPFGWRATDQLLRLIVKRAIPPSAKSSEFTRRDDQPMLQGTIGVS